jgi:carbon storage regulator
MLTLTRRSGERISIGIDIEVKILDISGGRVRIGIEAPRSTPVYRGELVDRIESENKRAAAGTSPPLRVVTPLPGQAETTVLTLPLDDVSTAPSAAPVAAPDSTILIPEGLYGLRGHTSWILCEVNDDGQSPCRALVSLLDDTIQLLVADAEEVCPNYPVDLARKAAGLEGEAVAIAAVVTLPADGSPASVNLMAPIVIGLTSRQGVQVILERADLGLRHGLSIKRAA